MEQTGAVPSPQPPLACAVVPVDFTVLKNGPEMALHDATGRLVFRIAAVSGGGRALLDSGGGFLVTVRSSSEDEWQAFSGSTSEQRNIIFSAKVISASPSQKEVHVFISPLSTFEDPKPSYRLLGSTFRRACTIIKGNSIVAQVIVTGLAVLPLLYSVSGFYAVPSNYTFPWTNLLYKLKKVFYSRSKFRVTIYPGNDLIIVLAMIMTFFVKK